MSKFGLYTKNANEAAHHVNVVDIQTKTQAEAYFAGVKQLTPAQFKDLFVVREITTSNKQLLYGNR